MAYQPRTFEAIMSIMKILTALFIIYVSFGEAFPIEGELELKPIGPGGPSATARCYCWPAYPTPSPQECYQLKQSGFNPCHYIAPCPSGKICRPCACNCKNAECVSV
ncbi:hypothetical protein ACROYT_G018641 [Oculina patagonica]